MAMKGALHTFHISRSGTSSTDVVEHHTQDTFFRRGVSPLYNGYSQHILSNSDRIKNLIKEDNWRKSLDHAFWKIEAKRFQQNFALAMIKLVPTTPASFIFFAPWFFKQISIFPLSRLICPPLLSCYGVTGGRNAWWTVIEIQTKITN